jgi:hypothetical protein
MEYKEFSVTYSLDEFQQKRLAQLAEKLDCSLDTAFRCAMFEGSAFDIDYRLECYAANMGMRDFPDRDAVGMETMRRIRNFNFNEKYDLTKLDKPQGT